MGKVVYEKSNSPEHKALVKRKTEEWEAFAKEQEQERMRESETEALDRAIAKSLAYGEVEPEVETNATPVDALEAPKCAKATDNITLKHRKDPFADLLTAAKSQGERLHPASGKVQRFPVPPHLRGKGKAAETAVVKENENVDEEDDEPVYMPASRFVR